MTWLKHQQTQFLTANPAAPAPPVVPAAAALALGTLSLKVIEIATMPPTLEATAPTVSGSVNNCFTLDTNHRVYIFNQSTPDANSRLQVLDVTDRAAPVQLASVFAAGSNDGYRAAWFNDLLWVVVDDQSSTSAPNTLRVFDVATMPPALLATYDLTADFADMQDDPSSCMASNGFVYIVNNGATNDRFGIYDGTNPLAVTQESITEMVAGGGQLALAIAYPLVYVYQGPPTSTLTIFDVSNPALPATVGSVGGFGNAIFISNAPDNGFLFAVAVSPADRGIRIVDVSTPAAPVLVASPLPAGVVNRNRATAARNGELALFCLEAAIGPGKIQVYDTTNAGAGTLAFLGELAYNANNQHPSSPYIDA